LFECLIEDWGKTNETDAG